MYLFSISYDQLLMKQLRYEGSIIDEVFKY